MRMRRALLLTLVLLAPVALAAAPPAGRELPWNLLDCTFAYASVPVPAARLAPYLPANWRPYLATPTTANAAATLVFEIDDCAEGSGIEGQLAPMQYASTWVAVVPPPAFRTDAPFTVHTWDVLVPDDERRALLQSVGAPARDGAIVVDGPADGSAPLHVAYAMEGAGSFAFDIVPSPAAPGALLAGGTPAGEFDQWIRGSDGSFTYWRTRWTTSDPHAGVGVVTLDPASWQAQALGATSVPAQFNFGAWDYHDGRIVLPG